MTTQNDFKATLAAVQKIMDTMGSTPEFQPFRRELISIGTRPAGLRLDFSRDGKKASMTDEFEDVEITRKDAPDVRFRGRLIAEADSKEETRQAGREKTRWTRLEVWELESGDWIAASIGCSDKPGEIDVGDYRRIARASGATIDLGDDLTVEPYDGGVDAMHRQAMEFFGWSWLAKALARNAGWDVVEQIR